MESPPPVDPRTAVIRMVLGGGLMILAFVLAWVFSTDGNPITRDELFLVVGFLAMGGLIFDTIAAVSIIRAVPWPWKRDGGASGQ